MSDDKRTYQSSLPVAVNGLKPVQSPAASGKKDGDLQSRRGKSSGGVTRSFSRELVLRLIERIQEK
jgi:hypothetical protein